jgi:hypothetical protein
VCAHVVEAAAAPPAGHLALVDVSGSTLVSVGTQSAPGDGRTLVLTVRRAAGGEARGRRVSVLSPDRWAGIPIRYSSEREGELPEAR